MDLHTFQKISQEPEQIQSSFSASSLCTSPLSSMWYISKRTMIDTTPGSQLVMIDQLWKLIIDIEQWPTWNREIITASLENPQKGIRSGQKGVIYDGVNKPFVLVDLEPLHYFAYGKWLMLNVDTDMFMASCHHFWEICQVDDVCSLEVGIVVSGMGAILYRPILSDNFSEGLIRILAQIKHRLERTYQL